LKQISLGTNQFGGSKKKFGDSSPMAMSLARVVVYSNGSHYCHPAMV